MIRHSWGSVLGLALALACSGAPDPDPAPPLGPYSPVAEVALSPAVAAPGTTIQVTASIANASNADLTVRVGGGPSAPLTTAAVEGGLTAQAQVSAGLVLGDVLVVIEGTTDRGPAFGAALARVSLASGCADGEVREAGGCVPRLQGHALAVEAMYLLGIGNQQENQDGRLMQHPRAVVQVGDALVGCHTDHIGVVATADSDSLSPFLAGGPLPSLDDVDVFDEGGAQHAETLLTVAGLKHCERLVVDEARGIAVSSSRGTLGFVGGLASWKIPALDAAPHPPVTWLATRTDPAGFGGIALADGVLYAARKPNRLATFAIDDEGAFQELADVAVPDMVAAWDVALDAADHQLYMTDTGRQDVLETTLTEGPNGTSHLDHEHTSVAGRLFVVDVTDPADPITTGWQETSGAAKGLAVLPDHVVATANGAAGVELFDVTDVTQPTSLLRAETPGTTVGVSFSDGYLLATDWDAIRVYDASERGVLRLLDGEDLAAVALSELSLLDQLTALGETLEESPTIHQGLIAASFASLDKGRFIVTDIDGIYTGRIDPGRRGPRLTLHDARPSVRFGAGEASQALALRLTNSGRELLTVRVRETSLIGSPDGPVMVPPGASATVEVVVAGLDGDRDAAPDRVVLETNDPRALERPVPLLVVDDHYLPGDPAPQFALPGVNWCDSSGCSMEPVCVRSDENLGTPVVLVFFASW